MVRLLWLAALSSCPMIDFLIANFFTESGGFVVSLSWATYEGLRFLGLLDVRVFCELSLSLLLITIVPNSNVSLLGVSMSMSSLGLPLLLMLVLSWELGWVFLLLLPELYSCRLVLLDCFLSPRLCSEVGSDYCCC